MQRDGLAKFFLIILRTYDLFRNKVTGGKLSGRFGEVGNREQNAEEDDDVFQYTYEKLRKQSSRVVIPPEDDDELGKIFEFLSKSASGFVNFFEKSDESCNKRLMLQ